MRINKYIAGAGYASRRKADELIQAGKVKVNGLTMNEPGYDVVTGDVVEVEGHKLEASEKKVYFTVSLPLSSVTEVMTPIGLFMAK